MNVGVYVSSVAPGGQSQQTFQGTILKALAEYKWTHVPYLISHERNPSSNDTFGMRYIPVRADGPWAGLRRSVKRGVGTAMAAAVRTTGKGGRFYATFRRWAGAEPAYYRDLDAHELRIIWFLNGHRLPTRIPYIQTSWDVNHRVHPMFPEYSYSRFGFDESESQNHHYYLRASYMICGTQVGKKQVADLYGVHEDRIRVIPFPTPALLVAADPLPSTFAAVCNSPYVIYPARLWPHKNHVTLIRTIRVLKDRGIKLQAVLTGRDEGNLPHVMNQARASGVADQIHWLGVVDSGVLRRLYEGAVCLPFVSMVGPDNLPPLEAFAAGCPVIAADVMGSREQYGESCSYFQPTDETSLADCITRVMAEPGLRESPVRLGRERAARWSAAAILDGILFMRRGGHSTVDSLARSSEFHSPSLL